MILPFKEYYPNKCGPAGEPVPTEFKQKILSGSKIHSIREDPHGRWKPGRKIHMATGVRTKNYFCFMEDICRSTQRIMIRYTNYRVPRVYVFIGGKLVIRLSTVGKALNFEDFVNSLPRNDGFDSLGDFFEWFHSNFQGVIIHWTDFKY